MSTVTPTIDSAYTPSRSTARALAYSLALSFVPHAQNSDTRKYVTITVVLTWAIVTIMRHAELVASGPHATQIYWGLTVLVFTILAHMWGFEYGVMSAIESDNGNGDTEDQ